ncbi:MAG: alpha/beta hydrolase [Acidimicrobiales bacterium]
MEPYFDPEIKTILEAGPGLGVVRADNLQAIRDSRALLNDQVTLSDVVTRTDHVVPGPDDNSELRLRVHKPVDLAEGSTAPCLYWMHGGGYVLGSPEQDDLRFDRWCQRFGIIGVGVEYRLAPEHPYPAGLDDSYAGLAWVKENGADLGIDTSQIGIGGPSAGGGMAAALGLLVRDRGEFSLDYQLLIYPMIDDTRTSVTANLDVPIWNPESNLFGWKSYLGDLFDAEQVPYHAAPARAEDLSGLPPTYIMVGTLDGFADEDINYAMRLNHAGVEVELHVYPGAPHGFEGFAAGAAVSRQARSDMNGWLARQLS